MKKICRFTFEMSHVPTINYIKRKEFFFFFLWKHLCRLFFEVTSTLPGCFIDRVERRDAGAFAPRSPRAPFASRGPDAGRVRGPPGARRGAGRGSDLRDTSPPLPPGPGGAEVKRRTPFPGGAGSLSALATGFANSPTFSRPDDFSSPFRPTPGADSPPGDVRTGGAFPGESPGTSPGGETSTAERL